ncbi:MAG: MFS transporter, partial [Bacteroidota bacterium]
IGCALVPYIEILIVLRFFQAIGISMCNVGGKAVVRDIFPPTETARIFSILGLIMGIAPIIAPTVGSWLLLGFGWQSIFYFLAIFSLLVILLLWQFLPNTMKKDEQYALTIRNVSSKYFTVVQNRSYLMYSAVTAMASAVLFSWISSSSFIFIELLGVSEGQFGIIFAATASCLIISNQVNIFLLKKFRSQDIALFAVIMELLVCGYLFYVVQFNFTITSMIVGMCSLMLFLHLITTNTMALGLNEIEKDLGVATAFMGSLRMALSAIATLILSYFLSTSALPMVVAIVIISVLSLTLQLIIRNRYDRE